LGSGCKRAMMDVTEGLRIVGDGEVMVWQLRARKD
jgi:hypothetical protein